MEETNTLNHIRTDWWGPRERITTGALWAKWLVRNGALDVMRQVLTFPKISASEKKKNLIELPLSLSINTHCWVTYCRMQSYFTAVANSLLHSGSRDTLIWVKIEKVFNLYERKKNKVVDQFEKQTYCEKKKFWTLNFKGFCYLANTFLDLFKYYVHSH